MNLLQNDLNVSHLNDVFTNSMWKILQQKVYVRSLENACHTWVP